ncbi:MAG: shikimate kinase [Acidobacteria bacterium]|nr:shikimate kinase [Acidobacteriota bacterium]
MRVFLVGFMGVGKTTVGRFLAQRLELPFVDLDEEVEATAGRSVAQIFTQEGEAGFRELELAALESVLRRPPAVVATGGGLPAQPKGAELLRSAGTTVWLDAPFELIEQRVCGGDQPPRPLFQDPEGAAELYRRRLPAYRIADHHIAVAEGDAPVALARRIADRLGDRSCAS